MSQFDNNCYMKINGYDLWDRFGLKSYQIKSDSDRLFGISRSIETEDSLKNNEFLLNIKNNRPTLDIELSKVDDAENAIAISDKDMDEIARIIFGKKVSVVEHFNYLYYGTFVDGTNWRNYYKQGYLCLKFELLSPYAYTPIYVDKKVCKDSYKFEIMNNSNVDDYCYLDVDIKQLGTTPIKITNLSTGENIKINNIELNEEIRVLSDYKEIYSLTNVNKNMFTNIEYDKNFLRLKYGNNRMKIEGNCICTFTYQIRMFIK